MMLPMIQGERRPEFETTQSSNKKHAARQASRKDAQAFLVCVPLR